MAKKKRVKIRRDNSDEETDDNDDNESLKCKLDALFQSVLANHDVDSKHQNAAKTSRSNAAAVNGVLKQEASTSNEFAVKKTDKRKSKQNASSHDKNKSHATKSPTTKKRFVCKECFKEYKSETGLKKHKCPDLVINTKKTADKRKTDATRKFVCVKNTNNESNGESDDASKTEAATSANRSSDAETEEKTDNRSLKKPAKGRKTVTFVKDLKTVCEQRFACTKCSEQFEHRRGFLHHTKGAKCNAGESEGEEEEETPTQSLDSLLDDIYSEFLN